jgi:hypothetical protein
VKIIAGILREEVGELVRRDLAARARRLRRALWLAATVLVFVSLFAFLAWWQSGGGNNCSSKQATPTSRSPVRQTLRSGRSVSLISIVH